MENQDEFEDLKKVLLRKSKDLMLILSSIEGLESEFREELVKHFFSTTTIFEGDDTF